MINQTPVSVGSSGQVVVRSSTVNLAAPSEGGKAGNAGSGAVGTVAPGQTALIDSQTISVGSSGIVVDGTTQAFTPLVSNPTPASAATITARGQTLAAEAISATVVVGGTTLNPGHVATIKSKVVGDGSSGLVVDGTTALFTTSSGISGQETPVTAITRFGSHTMAAVESSGTAVIDGVILNPGAVTTVDGHTVSDVSSGLVIDGRMTSLFADATTTAASTTLITIGSHTYTATEEGNGVVVIIGHTLLPGHVATIVGETISDASGKGVQASPTFPSLGGSAAGPTASSNAGAAGSQRVVAVLTGASA